MRLTPYPCWRPLVPNLLAIAAPVVVAASADWQLAAQLAFDDATDAMSEGEGFLGLLGKTSYAMLQQPLVPGKIQSWIGNDEDTFLSNFAALLNDIGPAIAISFVTLVSFSFVLAGLRMLAGTSTPDGCNAWGWRLSWLLALVMPLLMVILLVPMGWYQPLQSTANELIMSLRHLSSEQWVTEVILRLRENGGSFALIYLACFVIWNLLCHLGGRVIGSILVISLGYWMFLGF